MSMSFPPSIGARLIGVPVKQIAAKCAKTLTGFNKNNEIWCFAFFVKFILIQLIQFKLIL